MKKIKLSSKELRKRLIYSLVTGLSISLFISLLIIHFKSRQRDGAYAIHRSAFEFNQAASEFLYSSLNFSPPRPVPSKGKVPRFNGDIGLKDEVNIDQYKVHVLSPEKKFSIDIAEFYLLPKSGYSTEFKCIEGWSEDLQYAGVRFSTFMETFRVGKKINGSFYKYVGFETPDAKYYVSIDMESMLHPQTLLAYEMNLAPLSKKNGSPLRLIIPIKYGIKSLKRIGKIIFSDNRPKDYWTERGYDWYSGL